MERWEIRSEKWLWFQGRGCKWEWRDFKGRQLERIYVHIHIYITAQTTVCKFSHQSGVRVILDIILHEDESNER